MLNNRYHTINISDGIKSVQHKQFDVLTEPIAENTFLDTGNGFDLKIAETHILEADLFDLSTLNVAQLDQWAAMKTPVKVQIVGHQTGWNWDEWTAMDVWEAANVATSRRINLRCLIRGAKIHRTLGECAYAVTDGCTTPTWAISWCVPSTSVFEPFYECKAPIISSTLCTPATSNVELTPVCYPPTSIFTACTSATSDIELEPICYPPNYSLEFCNPISVE